MNEANETYNILWCQDRHKLLDKRVDEIETKTEKRVSSLENKFWGIIVLLFTNLAGVTTLIMSGG
jgi:hypothetical protein